MEEELQSIGAQIGVLGRAIAILTATLHREHVIDGNAVAQSIRLDNCTNYEAGRTLQIELADLIRRTIDGETTGLKVVE